MVIADAALDSDSSSIADGGTKSPNSFCLNAKAWFLIIGAGDEAILLSPPLVPAITLLIIEAQSSSSFGSGPRNCVTYCKCQIEASIFKL